MHMVRLFIPIKDYTFTPHHVLQTVYASCHAITLDDGRTWKDAPGSGRDMCKDMDAIQTPDSNLVGLLGPQEMENEHRVEDRS